MIYLFIFNKVPGADTATIAAISTAALTNGGRLCGRALSSATGKLTNAASIVTGTVCGKSAMYGSSNPVFQGVINCFIGNDGRMKGLVFWIMTFSD